ncbi:hypothetical protein [Actinomadura napierensis]|uniref:Uncharacterized protein n=1 Tax=Actinomadura napierensis TaxID=267854 RepID=A0ABN2ZIG6_9ACTN
MEAAAGAALTLVGHDAAYTGAWMRSSNSPGLLVTPEPGDPAPDPNN